MPKRTDKWRFAIGTTSRVPRSGGRLHYLIADFDRQYFGWEHLELLPWDSRKLTTVIYQKTKHGWHMYSDYITTFGRLHKLLEKMGADPAWISIGKERGYYFLADKSEIDFPYPVEHMVIHHGKEKARNT